MEKSVQEYGGDEEECIGESEEWGFEGRGGELDCVSLFVS